MVRRRREKRKICTIPWKCAMMSKDAKLVEEVVVGMLVWVMEVGGQVVSLGVGLCKLPGALKYSARKVSDKTLQKPGNHGLTLQAARSITTYNF